MAKRRIDMSEQPGAGGFSNPFTSLQEDLPDLPGPTPTPQGDPREDKPLPPQLVRQRALVRLERKGHGGKKVTRISEMARSEEDAAACLAHLRKQLGCGGGSHRWAGHPPPGRSVRPGRIATLRARGEAGVLRMSRLNQIRILG